MVAEEEAKEKTSSLQEFLKQKELADAAVAKTLKEIVQREELDYTIQLIRIRLLERRLCLDDYRSVLFSLGITVVE